MSTMRAIAARLATASVVVGLVVGAAGPASAAGTVEGAGSSFPQLEIEQWRSDVAKKPYSIKVNYVSSGSTFGRQQFIAGTVDFGVSDIAFQPDELPQVANRQYTYVTVSAGGVGFMYNLRDTAGRRIGFSTANGGNGKDLKLTPRTACRLLSEPGMRWNDAELVADNPDVALPDKPVKPVFRADGSGTGFVVQEFCIATAPDVWQKFVAYVNTVSTLKAEFNEDPFLQGKASSKWPVFAGQTGFAGDGVANIVATDTSGDSSITYVEAGFAEVRGFPNALVKNAAGVFHYPESKNVNVALRYARRNDDATVTLNYTTPDPEAYFPSSYSYAIVPTANIDSSKGADLATFLNYAVTKGQEKADKLGYAPLSAEIVDISLNEIVKIPGAPPKPSVVTFDPNSGGGTAGGGTTGGGTSGGGTTGGAITGGEGSDGSATGGDTSGGGTSGGGISGGGTSGGGTSGGATSGGSTSGGVTGGASGATGSTGAATGATGSAAGSTGAAGSGGSRNGVPTQVAGATQSRNGPTANAATIASPVSKPPSNGEVLITFLQGAALCGAAGAVVWRLQRRNGKATS